MYAGGNVQAEEGGKRFKPDDRLHLIFVVDNSGSMRKTDTGTPGETRSRAVLQACSKFIADQLADANASKDVYSFVWFSDNYGVVFSNEPLCPALKARVDAIKLDPRTGTQFGKAIDGMQDAIARCQTPDARSAGATNHVCIFLSDGKPGDHVIEKRLHPLREQHGAALTIHAIGYGAEDHAILKRIAAQTGGGFHQSGLRADMLRDVFVTISSSVTSTRTTSNAPPRQERAVRFEDPAAWLGNDGWTETNAWEMRYSDVTDNFTANAAPKRMRIRDQPFSSGGLRNVFHVFNLAGYGGPGEERHLVAKESKYVERYNDRLSQHRAPFLMQKKARELVALFNAQTQPLGLCPTFEYIPATVYRTSDPAAPGGFRYLLVEPYLRGKAVQVDIRLTLG